MDEKQPSNDTHCDTATPTSTSEINLGVGDLVQMHGLLGSKELNGRWGRIVTWASNTSRFGVKIDGVADPKSLKPANLRKLVRTNTIMGGSMPSDFMRIIPETPVFKVLLQFLPAKVLMCLACCQAHLRKDVCASEDVWSHAIHESFGGDARSAQHRLQCHLGHITSLHAVFCELLGVRRALSTVEVAFEDLQNASDFGVDAVVVSAHSSLRPFGPAAGSVFAKGGQELHNYIESRNPGSLEPGNCFWTPGFGLGTQGIIHAVGPTPSHTDGDCKIASDLRTSSARSS